MDFNNLNKSATLISKKFTTSGIGDIQSDLCSRQLITIPLNDRDFKYALLNEFDRSVFESLGVEEEYVDFSQLSKEQIDKEGVFVCEYNCSSNFFTASREYMNYIKKNTNLATLMIKVYGAEYTTNKIHDSINCAIRKDIVLPQIGNILLDMELDYLLFEETKYDVIDGDDGRYFILNINLPYSFYSKIPLMDSTFAYDSDTEKFYIEGNIVTTEQITDTILENYKYFSNPESFPGICISINNNEMIPFSRQGTDIFIAKFLKLPFIPATLVMSDAQIPFLLNKGKVCPITTAETNEVCKPYFIFTE